MYESVRGTWLADRRDVPLVSYQRGLGVCMFSGVRRVQFLLAIALKRNAVLLRFFLFILFFSSILVLFKVQTPVCRSR